MSEPSSRTELAKRIAAILDVDVERVEHGKSRQSRGRASRKRKHYYRVVRPQTRTRQSVFVEIHSQTYIWVNGELLTSAQSAMTRILNLSVG